MTREKPSPEVLEDMKGPDVVHDVEEAEEMAYAGKSKRFEAREEGVSPEDKQDLDRIAERREKEAQTKYRAEKAKVDELANELKEGKETPISMLFDKLNEIKNAFLDKGEFGDDGVKAAKHVGVIINRVQGVIDTLKNGYLRKYQEHPDITPESFLEKYQKGDTDFFKGGYGNIEVFKKSIVKSKIGIKRGLFDDTTWMSYEKKEESLNPKQEYYLYRELTGKKDFDEKMKLGEQKKNSILYNRAETTIPNVFIEFKAGESLIPGVQKLRNPMARGFSNDAKKEKEYSWNHETTELTFGNDFLKKVFEEAQASLKKES